MAPCSLNQAMLGTVDRDERCFEAVYDTTRRRVYLTCFGVCRDRGIAEELTGDVFRLVWQKAHLWRSGVGSVEGWVVTIARNRAIDWRRGQSEAQHMDVDLLYNLVDDSPPIDNVLIQAENYEEMRIALQGLPPHQRSAIESAFFGGLTYLELAERSKVPVGTMKTWIRRGLAKMRAQLSSSSNQSKDDPSSLV